MSENLHPYLNDPIAITSPVNREVPDHQYIMSISDFRVLFGESNNIIRHPITIINVNYSDCPVKDKRIDFVTAHYTLRSTCRNLRIAAGEKRCMECDDYFARYCCALAKGIDGEAIAVPETFVSSYKDHKPRLQTIEIDTGNEEHPVEHMQYLEYNCPMLGYTELCFPIRFRNKVIAVMFVGEIQKAGEGEKTTRINILNEFINMQDPAKKESIFHEYAPAYEAYVKNNPDSRLPEKFSLDKLRETDGHESPFYPQLQPNEDIMVQNYINEIVNESDFQTLIRKCCEEVFKIEKRLKEKWEEKCRRHYRDTVREITEVFNRTYNDIRKDANELSYEEVQRIFKAVWRSVIQLKKSLGFDYCRIYENFPFITGRNFANEFKTDRGICDYNDLAFDFEKSNLGMAKLKNSIMNQEVLDRFTYKEDGETHAVTGSDQVAVACENMAFLFGVRTNYAGHENECRICFEEICNEFIYICAEMENAALLFFKNKHIQTLSLYRHEMTHLAQRMRMKGRQISSADRLMRLSDVERDLIAEDIESITRTMQRLSRNISMVQSNESLAERRSGLKDGFIYLRNELNKWRSTYRLELSERNIRLDDKSFLTSGNLYYETDPELFSIMLFNLIDNAIKYAYWGTRITIQAYRDEVRITDYGMGIEAKDRERIFDLYYRSPNAIQGNIGDGIGLYSSKRIAELLGYTIECSVCEAAPFHLGFANLVSLESPKNVLRQQLLSNFYNYNSYINKHADVITDRYDDRSNTGRDMVTEEQIKDKLFDPTYEVTFVIKENAGNMRRSGI